MKEEQLAERRARHGAAKRGVKVRFASRDGGSLGQMGAREQPQRGRGEADGSETGGMAPDRLNFGAYPNLHPRPCPIAHAQPTSQHSAASTVARCGEGGMVGGWLAGASPSDPLSG